MVGCWVLCFIRFSYHHLMKRQISNSDEPWSSSESRNSKISFSLTRNIVSRSIPLLLILSLKVRSFPFPVSLSPSNLLLSTQAHSQTPSSLRTTPTPQVRPVLFFCTPLFPVHTPATAFAPVCYSYLVMSFQNSRLKMSSIVSYSSLHH